MYQEEHRLSRKVYEWDQSLGYKGWAGDIRKIYNKFDFPQLKPGKWRDLDFLYVAERSNP